MTVQDALSWALIKTTTDCKKLNDEDEADNRHPRWVCFGNGNVLIDNDGENVKLYYADNDTSTAQRTATVRQPTVRLF
jgi:hypothetical protein